MKYRPLLLRSNRALGNALVERNWVDVDQLERANDELLKMMQSEQYDQANILKILITKLKILSENDVLEKMIEEFHLPLLDVRTYETNSLESLARDHLLCQLTWTLPFNQRDGIHYVVTANYLSEPIREKWQEVLGGPILWYLSSISLMETALNRLR